MNKIYCGSGWQSKFGVHISIKKSELDKLPVNKWGDYMLEVVERKSPDDKSKATHYVSVNTYGYEKAGIPLQGQDDHVKPSDDKSMPF